LLLSKTKGKDSVRRTMLTKQGAECRDLTEKKESKNDTRKKPERCLEFPFSKALRRARAAIPVRNVAWREGASRSLFHAAEGETDTHVADRAQREGLTNVVFRTMRFNGIDLESETPKWIECVPRTRKKTLGEGSQSLEASHHAKRVAETAERKRE